MALRGSLIRLVTGDRLPDSIITLTDRKTGKALDLTGVVTALGHFRAKGTTLVLFDALLIPLTPKTLGKCTLTWPQAVNTPGHYEMEIELTGSGGKQQTPFDTLQFLFRQQFA